MPLTDEPAPAGHDHPAPDRPLGPARLIVNPRAGDGRTPTVLPQLTSALAAGGLDFDVVHAAHVRDAGDLARAALDEGVRYLIAVGGDGTVHHVVNGMFADGAPIAEDAVLGVCGVGPGADFVRNFGLDRDPATVARHLLTPHTMPIDLGVVELTASDGSRTERLFVNVAEVGYGAELIRRAGRLPRVLGRVRYLLGAWAAIARIGPTAAQVSVDFTTRDLTLTHLVVANGQFTGDGMKVAPRAIPQDGRYSVLAFTGGRAQVFLLTTALYAGEHLPDPQIVEYQSATCGITTATPLPVAADGEPLGTTPARFTMRKRALLLKI